MIFDLLKTKYPASTLSRLHNTNNSTSRFWRSSSLTLLLGGIYLSCSQIGLSLADTEPLLKPEIAQRLPTTEHIIQKIRAAISAQWNVSRQQQLLQAMLNEATFFNAANDNQTREIPKRPAPKFTNPIDSPEGFQPVVGTSLKYDSNLLRLADNNSSGPKKEGEFIKQIRAGIAAKWNISRQQLLVKAIVNQNWFSTYNELDYLGHDISAQWNWQVSHSLKGELGFNHQKSLRSFSQINQLTRSIQVEANYFLRANYEIQPDWFIHSALSEQDFSYETQAEQSGNRIEDTLQVGVRYLNANYNMLGFKVDLSTGRFPKREFTAGSFYDNGYAKTHYNVEWNWNYSVKTRLNGQVGYLTQSFDHLHVYDFDNITARINANWDISSKTALQLSANRDVYFAGDINASFVLVQGIKIEPSWLAKPKLRISLPITYDQQEYLGNPGFVTSSGGTQHDEVFTIAVNTRYKPVDYALFEFYVGYEQRDSTNINRIYNTEMVGLNMQVAF